MRHRRLTLAGVVLALAVAAPVSANSSERFSWQEEIVDTSSCGVVLTTTILADVTVHLAGDGSWRSTAIRLRYDGVAVDTTTGASMDLTARQNLTEVPGGPITTRGQGIFLRVPGTGVVLHDVGRLVFDPSDGATLFRSAKVIPFDDPTAGARIDAAVCSLFS